MAFSDYIYFQNPGIVALALGAIIFIFLFYALTSFLRLEKGVAILVGVAISGIATWKFYSEGFLGSESILSLFIALIVIAVIFVLFRAIFRGVKRRFS